MEPIPYGWRAGEGYIPPPGIQPSAQPPPPGYVYYLVPPTPPTQYVCVPTGAPPAAPVASSVASTAVSSTASSQIKATGDGKTKAAGPPPAKKDDKPKNPNSPPPMRAGMNYMFPPEHTKLHIFNKTSKVWEAKYAGKEHQFKIFSACTQFTPGMVIENVLRKKGDDAKGWAVTEVMEAGNGTWIKGSTIEYGSDKAKATLGSMGWTGKRGEKDGLPPVWCVVHKM